MGDSIEEAEHGFALADDVLKAVALLECAAKEDDFGLGASTTDGGADVEQQLLVIPGLLDEVVGSCTNGFDDVADGAIRGDHDDRELGAELDDAREQIEAAFAGQGEVEKKEVELFAREQIEASRAFRSDGD